MCANQENICWSLFSDPLGRDYSLFPFSLISCPELSAFLLAVDFQQSFLWDLPPEKKLGEKGGFSGRSFVSAVAPQATAGLQGGMSPALMGLSQPGAPEGLSRSREDMLPLRD